ncbi:hypothetical protein B0H19DRAFT_1104496, partial [Mycena capillaripes]
MLTFFPQPHSFDVFHLYCTASLYPPHNVHSLYTLMSEVHSVVVRPFFCSLACSRCFPISC